MYKRKISLVSILVLVILILIGCSSIPKIISPKKNFHIDRVDPTFEWKFGEKENLRFEIKIAEDPHFTKNLIYLQTTQSHLTLNIPYLKQGGKYYWVVRAIYYDDSTGETVITKWSYENMKQNIPYIFYVDQDAKGYTGFSPKIKSPKFSAKLMSLKPEFSWSFPDHSEAIFKIKNINDEWVSPIYDEIQYEVLIARDDAFTTDLKKFEINKRKSFKLSIPYLKKGEKYYWRIRAKYFDPVINNYNNSEWSSYNPKEQQGTYIEDVKKPYDFIVSKNARGDFGLEAGQEEEVSVSKISENVTQLTTNESNDWFPAVSKDGNTLAFCSDRDSGSDVIMSEIYYINLTGRVGTGERRKTSSNPGIKNLNPFWLNDNENVGFYSNRLRRDPDHYNLFHSNKGKGVSYINDGMNYLGDGEGYLKKGSLLTAYCSKNNEIVYTIKTEYGKEYFIWLFNKRDNSFTQLVSGVFPNIVNDKIVYSIPKSKTNWNIWIMDLEKTSIFNETQLTSEIDVKDYDPSLSPNGSKIAYASDRKTNADIWIMNSDGTDQRQLTYHPMPDRNPVWADNETIVFQSKRNKDKNGIPQWDIFLLKISD